MADEQNLLGVANTFLAQVLAADSELVALVSTRIKADFSLEVETGTVSYPLVSFAFMADSNVLTMGARRLYSRPKYHVMAHGTGGYGAISAAANRLVAILGNRRAVSVTFDGVAFSVDSYIERQTQPHPDVLPGGQVVYGRGVVVCIHINAAA